jgi:hypothetical protein
MGHGVNLDTFPKGTKCLGSSHLKIGRMKNKCFTKARLQVPVLLGAFTAVAFHRAFSQHNVVRKKAALSH